MVTFALEFDSEKELRQTAARLWTKLGVRGELGIRRVDERCWRLEVNSEKDLRQSTIDSLKGRPVPLEGSRGA